ncbi:hypothetical protein V1Y59_08695 [Gordonia sp. PKS22-38]|uniref:Uncharacterized protein n=1 Tax=Gordonia prachuapensis TaxID=3115651 RepID=A0ABU7MS90_9ACTN|nr:hypothetical protein [Gordonia sp. PKS22-38]
MTAANISGLVELRPARVRSLPPTVVIAGVRWPAYKVHALLVAVLVAVGALLITGSGQVVACAAGAALLSIWWGERLWVTRRSA